MNGRYNMPLSPHIQQTKLPIRALCLFMCRTYFGIIVYKYFAIGCCKLCRIVCLLGHILLSYIVYSSIFNSGHIHFFTILNIFFYFCLPFVSFVYCSMLFPFCISLLLLVSFFPCTFYTTPRAFDFPLSYPPYLLDSPSLSFSIAAFSTLFATTIQ